MAKHYHYLIGSQIKFENNSFEMASLVTNQREKISSKNIQEVFDFVLREYKKRDNSVISVVVFSINSLECACDE